jgi:hypothetical protein
MPERPRISSPGPPVTIAEMSGHDRRNTHFGAFLNKYAPVRGGETIKLMKGE